MMYFSRITVQPRMEIFSQLQSLLKNLYSSHALLWSLFPEDKEKERDFLFRQEQDNNVPRYYLLSERKPENRVDYITVETKPYDPVIKKGNRFRFNIRLNPVVTRKNGPQNKPAKHDIWMDAKKEAKEKGLSPAEGKSFVENNVKKWFVEKCTAWGFSVLPGSPEVQSYNTHFLRKRNQKAPIKFSTIDYTGILEVTDPEAFKEHLLNGIGRARAFGCGLLLLKRMP